MNGFGFADLWRGAEDLLRRAIKSRAVREAEKRRQERRQLRSWLKMRRAGAAAALSGGGTLAAAMALAPPTMAVVAAGGAALIGIVVGSRWQRRGPDRFSREELAALPGQAEDWLLDRRLLLPQTAGPAVDIILNVLGELPPRLERLEPNSSLAWDARRLIGDHLPSLVGAWCGLPAMTRDNDGEARMRLLDGLATLAGELTRLCEEVSRDERMMLETCGRFLDARYNDGRLSGGG